jgi:hypothetical protein
MNKIAEQARLRASLEELARFGSPVDLSVADPRNENEKVEIEQLGGPLESRAFELPNRRIGYMAYIAVTTHRTRTTHVIDLELRTPWDDPFFQWLLPSRVNFLSSAKRARSQLVYEFPSEPGLVFPYDEVINHHLLERRKLPGNCPLEGWLLGIGGLMPDNLVHGELLEMSLTIIGADHAEYSASIRLWTERLLARTKIMKPRTSIFAKLGEEEAMLARDVTGTAPLPASQPPASNRT